VHQCATPTGHRSGQIGGFSKGVLGHQVVFLASGLVGSRVFHCSSVRSRVQRIPVLMPWHSGAAAGGGGLAGITAELLDHSDTILVGGKLSSHALQRELRLQFAPIRQWTEPRAGHGALFPCVWTGEERIYRHRGFLPLTGIHLLNIPSHSRAIQEETICRSGAGF